MTNCKLFYYGIITKSNDLLNSQGHHEIMELDFTDQLHILQLKHLYIFTKQQDLKYQFQYLRTKIFLYMCIINSFKIYLGSPAHMLTWPVIKIKALAVHFHILLNISCRLSWANTVPSIFLFSLWGTKHIKLTNAPKLYHDKYFWGPLEKTL